MTLFYGLSNSTRRKNYLEKYIDQKITEGFLVSKKEKINFMSFATYLDKTLLNWIEQKIPQLLILKKLFIKMNNDSTSNHTHLQTKLFNPTTFYNNPSAWHYKPLESVGCIK